jgi:hypothetical protein
VVVRPQSNITLDEDNDCMVTEVGISPYTLAEITASRIRACSDWISEPFWDPVVPVAQQAFQYAADASLW